MHFNLFLSIDEFVDAGKQKGGKKEKQRFSFFPRFSLEGFISGSIFFAI